MQVKGDCHHMQLKEGRYATEGEVFYVEALCQVSPFGKNAVDG